MTKKKKTLTPGQIARKRAEHGLSQRQLAKYMAQIGFKVSPSYIHFVEGGYKPDNPAILEALTERLTQDVPLEVRKAVAEKKERAKQRRAAEKRKERRLAREAREEANA